jgi:hypothetical protein
MIHKLKGYEFILRVKHFFTEHNLSHTAFLLLNMPFHYMEQWEIRKMNSFLLIDWIIISSRLWLRNEILFASELTHSTSGTLVG